MMPLSVQSIASTIATLFFAHHSYLHLHITYISDIRDDVSFSHVNADFTPEIC
jgi:hypothetical protein